MAKHTINAFLATSVAFANEISTLCEHVDADAKEVEKAIKSDKRIGKLAYLSPGGPFAGGTLARDINYLADLSKNKKGFTQKVRNRTPLAFQYRKTTWDTWMVWGNEANYIYDSAWGPSEKWYWWTPHGGTSYTLGSLEGLLQSN